MNLPPTAAALPSTPKPEKSPKAKEFFFDTLTKITRQPSVKKEKTVARALAQESFRVRSSGSFDANRSFDSFAPEEYYLKEGEERYYLDPKSQQAPEFQQLMNNIKNWINLALGDSDTRILVNDLEEDIFDGLVLKVLLERLNECSIQMPEGEFVQAEEKQKRNLAAVLAQTEEIIGIDKEGEKNWNVNSIFERNLLPTVHLLLAIIKHFVKEGKALIDLPKVLKINVIKVKKELGTTKVEINSENLIGGYQMDRDGFDTLIHHAPEKLSYVKKSLLHFANFYLGKIDRRVETMDDFRDGVNFILLIGLLDGFFVPLHAYDPAPSTPEARLSNLNLAFDFLRSAGIRLKNRPVEVATGDVAAVLRILYYLFVKYEGGRMSNDGK